MSNKYLICTNYISEKSYTKIRSAIASQSSTNEAFEYWINWKQMPNEILVQLDFTKITYQLPLEFDTLFLVNNPEYYVLNKVKINQALRLNTIPVNEISTNHQHFTVLSFENKIPTIIKLLQATSNKDALKFDVKIGICNSINFSAIKQIMKLEAFNRFSEPRF